MVRPGLEDKGQKGWYVLAWKTRAEGVVRAGLEDKGQKGWYRLAWKTRGRRGGTGWPGRQGAEGVARAGLED